MNQQDIAQTDNMNPQESWSNPHSPPPKIPKGPPIKNQKPIDDSFVTPKYKNKNQ
jgi:hypothetical protein